MSPFVLEIKNLQTVFETSSGVLPAVDGVSLSIPRGKVVALVGESGCGKSVTALSVLRLVSAPGKITKGEILFHSKNKTENILKLSEKEMQGIRGNRMAMIFQEPMTSLNPVFTVGDQIAEAILLHQKVSKKEATEKTIEILKKVGIPNPELRINDYPHQMSGGMRQRVMIAMGLSCKPELLIADEPTTALDVTIQAQILELMHELIAEMGMSLLLITHDLGIVAEHAEFVAVMYAGKIVEEAHVIELFKNPKHPYTKGLLASIPNLSGREEKLKAIKGTVPDLTHLPSGCSFADRCEKVQDVCRQKMPDLVDGGNGHLYRCYFPG